MKVTLANKKTNCRAYGIDFNENGLAEVKPAVAESLIATGVLIEVKAAVKAAKV